MKKIIAICLLSLIAFYLGSYFIMRLTGYMQVDGSYYGQPRVTVNIRTLQGIYYPLTWSEAKFQDNDFHGQGH